jgi:predicted LPLAT superfamily acyltransferase
VSGVDPWRRAAEVGTVSALGVMRGFYRLFGRRLSSALLHPIAGYYHLMHADIRQASLGYLERLYAFPGGAEALGGRPGRAAIHRHVHEFAVNLFDRMVIWGESLDEMDVEKERSRPLLDLARSGSGGILVGAHLGSFDMLRLVAQQHQVAVQVLMYTDHAERINAFFEKLEPGSRVRVLGVDPTAVRTPFLIRECVERGEFVGILADRIHPAGRERVVRVPFLGRPAAFPATPFELATVLGCPLLQCLCVRTGDARYETLALPLFSGGRVPRAEREKAARELVESYVAELERWCLRAPYQWFNFYDFWA